nr:Crp/Fnr family transcriptional regulator [Halomonas socia]
MTIVKLQPHLARANETLSLHPLLQGMPDTEALVEALLRDAFQQRAAHGEFLFREGDRASHYLLVESGCVEVMRYGADGEERVFHQFMPGQLVAEVATFMTHGRYPMNARAVGDTRVIRVSCAALRRACERHPGLAMRLLENISMRLYRNINEIEWLTASTAAQRLAAYLLRLRERQANEDNCEVIRLPISQRQLASQLGVRAETVSRLFSEWLERGYVCGGRGVWRLCDLHYLRALASEAERAF